LLAQPSLVVSWSHFTADGQPPSACSASHLPSEFHLNWRTCPRAMNLPTTPKLITLVCCLLPAYPLRASTDIMASHEHSPMTQVIAGAQSTLLAVLVAPTQDQGTTPDDSGTPKQTTTPVPASYVGTVVGLMFLSGVILLMIKLQRRKPRRSIYRYGRPRYGRSRSGRSSSRSHGHRRAA
jgi:hypothetical protein